MASLGMSLPVDCFKHGPTRPDHKPLPFASLLPDDPALALEQLDVPLDSVIADLPVWIDNFFKAKTPDDDYAQFYVEIYAAIKPNRARVPPEYLEEFKTRAGASPAIWQIEEARACAPEACDVVPPTGALNTLTMLHPLTRLHPLIMPPPYHAPYHATPLTVPRRCRAHSTCPSRRARTFSKTSSLSGWATPRSTQHAASWRTMSTGTRCHRQGGVGRWGVWHDGVWHDEGGGMVRGVVW